MLRPVDAGPYGALIRWGLDRRSYPPVGQAWPMVRLGNIPLAGWGKAAPLSLWSSLRFRPFFLPQ